MASDYQDQPHLPVEYQAWMLTHHTERVPGLHLAVKHSKVMLSLYTAMSLSGSPGCHDNQLHCGGGG